MGNRNILVHLFGFISTAILVVVVGLRISLAMKWVVGNPVQSAMGSYALFWGATLVFFAFGAIVICAMDAYKRRLGWWLFFIIFGNIPMVVLYYWLSYRPGMAHARMMDDINASGLRELPPLTDKERGN